MPVRVSLLFLLLISFCTVSRPVAADPIPINPGGDYKQYTDYFEEVYKTFQDNYYLAPDRKVYDHFLDKFKKNIYAQLKGEGKSNDYVRWRSSWYLVDALKSKDDRFTQYWPPKPAEKFKQEVMAQRIDLGIEGKKNGIGFLVTRMEPHSDAYSKGLLENDIILQIDGQSVAAMTQKDIESKLTPVVNSSVKLSYLSNETKMQKTIEVVCKEYFKQTVFLHPVDVDGVYCLEITHFNEMTPPEVDKYLEWIEKQNAKGLVLDLRDNPGGQVGGALEIASFFLPQGQEFAYFLKRNEPKYDLVIPKIGDQYEFNGPVVILVNDGTGSCAELFSGIMQFNKRAVVLGVNTAGQILLKNMFTMDDGSTIALVTARAYYPDGSLFGFDGITPNKIISDAPKDGLINLAAALIAMKTKQ